MNRTIFIWSVASAAAAALPAGPSLADTITLSTGEVLTVTIHEVTNDTIRFSHPVLGDISLARSVVSGFVRDEPPEGGQAPGAAPASEGEAAGEAPVSEPARLSFFQGWTGSVEGGLAGSDGNTETLNYRFGVAAERITDTMETRFGAAYAYAEDDGEKSKSRGEINLRNDWLFKDSPWGFFALGKAEYDEFQDWDWRLSAFAGPSYAFIKNDTTLLRGRVGAGGSYEIGGEDEEFTPEGLIGLDFEHKFDERSSVFAYVDYLPSLDDFPEYRIDAKAGYQIMVDPDSNMFLKIGIADRYDSDPGEDREKNDIDYFLTVGWTF